MTTEKKVPLRRIFLSFTRIGAVLFGGGYAMLPLLEREVVNRRHWCDEHEMVDYFAMAQLVPGVITVNTSMLIGHRLRGFAGTVAALIGVVLVPFFVLLAYALAFDSLDNLDILKNAMNGVCPAVAGVMSGVAYKMFKQNCRSRLGLLVTVITVFLALVIGVPAVWLIVSGVLTGILWFFVQYRKLKESKP
ncbi:MAG: chromate transporter [Kiritimatiellia bacterium]